MADNLDEVVLHPSNFAGDGFGIVTPGLATNNLLSRAVSFADFQNGGLFTQTAINLCS